MTNYRQNMAAVPRVYSLPRCSVALFNTGDGDVISGAPLGSLVWQAKQVDNLRVSESYDETPQYSTGIPYPEIHHTREHHEIIFDAIWNIGAKLQRNTEYQLAITWRDAGLGPSTVHYVQRFYSGVTTPVRRIQSRSGNEFESNNVLRAKFYFETESDGEPAEAESGTETFL